MTVKYQLTFNELDADLIAKIKSQFGKRSGDLRITLEIAEIDETESILSNPELAEKIQRRRKSASNGNVLNFTPESFNEIVAKYSI